MKTNIIFRIIFMFVLGFSLGRLIVYCLSDQIRVIVFYAILAAVSIAGIIIANDKIKKS